MWGGAGGDRGNRVEPWTDWDRRKVLNEVTEESVLVRGMPFQGLKCM